MKIRYSSKFDSDRITVVLDERAEDFHVDAKRGYNSDHMDLVLDHIYDMGYETLPDDECEAEILDSGAIRIYLVPTA